MHGYALGGDIPCVHVYMLGGDIPCVHVYMLGVISRVCKCIC